MAGSVCLLMQSEGLFYDAGTRSARMPNNTTTIDKTDDLGFDASRVVPTANEKPST